MTAYADHSFYSSEYLSGRAAAVPDTDFPYYARGASAVIDMYTHRSIDSTDVPEAVRLCCCELAEQLYKADHTEAAAKEGIASESVQGWSQSYENSEARRTAGRSAQRDIIYRWLSGTGLLYSGV